MVLRAMPMPIVIDLLALPDRSAVTAAAPSSELICALSVALTLSPPVAPAWVVIVAVFSTSAVMLAEILFSV